VPGVSTLPKVVSSRVTIGVNDPTEHGSIWWSWAGDRGWNESGPEGWRELEFVDFCTE
jgi:hypothetical protein